MTAHKLSISGSQGAYAVRLDEREIADSITSIDLSIDGGGELPIATLGLRAWAVDDTVLDVDVQIPESTRDLLVRLGWAPPRSADLPPEVHALGLAADQMREEWMGADQVRRRELHREVRYCSEGTWRLANNPPPI